MPIAVTEAASAVIKHLLNTTERESEEQVLRIVANSQGDYGFVLDLERENDHILRDNGATIVLVDLEVGERLSGATLDVQETPQGPAFRLTE